jgi:hypothetical protein
MIPYKEFTFGWLIVWVMVPIQAFIIFLYSYQIGDRPLPTLPFLAIMVLLIIVLLLFYGLTTEVTSEHIKITFGIGLISRKIKLGQITGVKIVTNPMYYGWGIRYIPNGMLYNISGTKGIELRFYDTDKVIRIGSAKPAELMNEIARRIAPNL